ncbi:hypothetical protein R70006_06054 [Paraburkholderia domus]|jgi:TonB family C-terminal domain|uniref:energy transducer TonB family protein n=1 Tax=Paraburkholderia domus TaxID=2793075 RepID=UPI001B2E26C0|nr:hypothetical protein R70006_06054 [Paraburkholderia domus]
MSMQAWALDAAVPLPGCVKPFAARCLCEWQRYGLHFEPLTNQINDKKTTRVPGHYHRDRRCASPRPAVASIRSSCPHAVPLWLPPYGLSTSVVRTLPTQGLLAVVRASVDAQGKVTDAVLVRSSEDPMFDDIALRKSQLAICNAFTGTDGKPVAIETEFHFFRPAHRCSPIVREETPAAHQTQYRLGREGPKPANDYCCAQ